MLQIKATFQTEADYQSFYPTPPLSAFIKEYWIMRLHKEAVHTKAELEQPELHPEIIFKFGVDYEEFHLHTKTKKIHSTSNISGVSNYAKASKRTKVEENLLMVGVKLSPLGMYALLKMPLIELYNECIPIHDLPVPFLGELEDRLSNIVDTNRLVATLDQAFIHFYTHSKIPSDSVRFYEKIKGLNQTNIQELMTTKDIGYKYLERNFKKYLGINPKKRAKLLRFKAFYEDWISNSQYKYIDLVYKHDYFDQNHLIKDFKAIFNTSPGKFLTSMNSNFTQHITKANLALRQL